MGSLGRGTIWTRLVHLFATVEFADDLCSGPVPVFRERNRNDGSVGYRFYPNHLRAALTFRSFKKEVRLEFGKLKPLIIRKALL